MHMGDMARPVRRHNRNHHHGRMCPLRETYGARLRKVRKVSRDPEYQADCTKSIIFQWKNGAMDGREALDRLDRLYETYEYRKAV